MKKKWKRGLAFCLAVCMAFAMLIGVPGTVRAEENTGATDFVVATNTVAGFYGKSEITVENYLEEQKFTYSGGNMEFYFAYNAEPEEGVTAQPVDKENQPCDTPKLYTVIDSGEEEVDENSATITTVSGNSAADNSNIKIYKITLQDGFDKGNLRVYLKKTSTDGNEGIEFYDIELSEPWMFEGIDITEEGYLWDNNESRNVVYYKVNEKNIVTDVTPEKGEQAPTDYSFSYDKSNHTLTLNKMKVTRDEGSVISSYWTPENGELTINLIGDNVLTTKLGTAIFIEGNATVTTENQGKLTAVTESGLVKDDEQGHVVEAGAGADGAYYSRAIALGGSCTHFCNEADITAVAEKVKEAGEAEFDAYNLTCGNPSYKDDKGQLHTLGVFANFGTVDGIIQMCDTRADGLVSCNTKYGKPTDHEYIGKAYYFTKDEIYPNNVIQNLSEGEWRVVGKYNADGTPKPSKIFYQYIYKDSMGTVYTEDRTNPIQFLVYDKNPESLLTENDVAAVDDGEEHTFNRGLYAVWFTDGKVTVNGNVMLDVACSSSPQEGWVEREELDKNIEAWEMTSKITEYNKISADSNGEMCYKKDADGEVLFHDSSKASITINGSTGFLSISDTYQGDVYVRDDVNFSALYKEKEFLKKWIYRLQWQYDGSPYHPEEVYYCAIPSAGKVLENGALTQKVKDLAFAEGVKLAGQGLYEGTYYSQTETTMNGESVAGTSAAVSGSSLIVNVSKKSGLEKDTYPLVRKTDDAAVSKVKEKLSDTDDMIPMDIAVIQQTKNEKKEVTAQKEVEPSGTVNVYFDRLDLSKFTKPALYHLKDDGTIEKIAIDRLDQQIKIATNSFSTYVFAEDQTISTGTNPGGTPSDPGGNPSGTGGTPSGNLSVSTETRPDGTKVETQTEVKPDGSKTTLVKETSKEGNVKTTETITKADGSATMTVKETETNAKGNKVAVTTTTQKDTTGATVSVTEESVIAATSTTVTVKKDKEGEVTLAEATVVNTVKKGNKATISASVIDQIKDAAGTNKVAVTMVVKNAEGATKYSVKAEAGDLKAGKSLYIFKRNTKTGKYTMVDAKTYKVSKSGNVAVSMKKKADYELVNASEAAKISKAIKKTIKPKKASVSVKKGKKTSFKLNSKADKDNIKSITYISSNKSLATVSKKGKITAKKAGTITVKAKVTLKNGTTKTIKMKIKVK